MQSNFEVLETGNQQQHFMDSNSCSSPLLPIFNPQKPSHHHFHQQQLQQQPPEPYHHISHLVHPIPITHDLFQRQNHFQALQQQQEEQGRLQWQMSPVNFKLGLNENSVNGERGGGGLVAAGFLDENGTDPRLGFKSWQTQEYYGIRKEPICWKPMDAAMSNTNKKLKQANEGEICKDLESKYRHYGELEAIYSLAKMGEANQTGSGSALTGENSSKHVDVEIPVPLSDPHGFNVAPAGEVGMDHGSDASFGEEFSPRKIQKRKKRKRTIKEQLSSMTGFFESLVKQVMDHQENLHNKYLQVVEKLDRDRREREEAWRRQEAENHKREAMAKVHEQALASRREALIVSYIEKITGQKVNLPSRQTPLLWQPYNVNEPVEELTPTKIDDTNCRWPKSEVEALILARSRIETKVHEPGMKGHIWEEVSAQMDSMGYQRSAKRCKEKWENMNKYFRKTKESGKKGPRQAKTCSYFDKLDQLYSKTPMNDPSCASSYYPDMPSVGMDFGTETQGYTGLLGAFIAGRDAGGTHNLSTGNFENSEMESNMLDFDGIVDGNLELVQGESGDQGKEKANSDNDGPMGEEDDTYSDDSEE